MKIDDIKIFDAYVEAMIKYPLLSEGSKILPDDLKESLARGLTADMVTSGVWRTYFVRLLQSRKGGFKVDENNTDAIDQLIAALPGTKGVMLMGNIGCGKTTLLKGFGYLVGLFQQPPKKLEVIPTYRITSEYNQEGDVIFGTTSEYGFNPGFLVQGTLLFDDLGSEAIGNHFGRSCNVMEEVLLRRYDTKAKTHCTTNLDAAALKKLYGPRVASRLKEMFIQIHLKGDDRRK